MNNFPPVLHRPILEDAQALGTKNRFWLCPRTTMNMKFQYQSNFMSFM